MMQVLNYTLGVASLLSTFLLSGVESQQSPHIRSFFYIGGEYVNTTAGLLFQNQMYVEKLLPAGGSTNPFPVVFIHGGAQSGTVSHTPTLVD